MGVRRLVAVVAGASALWMVAAGPAAAQPLACGQVITQDTRLDADMNCPFGATGQRSALVIGAPNITLDLGGHTISGERAVSNPGFDGVTIENGTSEADEGIVLLGVTRNTVRNVTVHAITEGIELYESDHNRIVRNTLIGAALEMNQGSDRNTIAGNKLTFAEGVIFVNASDGNVVTRNDLDGSEAAIELIDAAHNWVVRNRVTSDFGNFGLVRSDGNVLADNVADWDSTTPTPTPIGPGVGISESSHNLLIRNTFKSKTRGVWLRSGTGNVLLANRATDTIPPVPTLPPSERQVDPDGFLIEAAASETLLDRNVALRSVGDGFDVEAPGTRLRRNTANDNGDLGFEAVLGVIDLGGNRASGNGNPLQCLNVLCR